MARSLPRPRRAAVIRSSRPTWILSRATREMAIRRGEHPLFKAWWEMGKEIHSGEDFSLLEYSGAGLLEQQRQVRFSPGCPALRPLRRTSRQSGITSNGPPPKSWTWWFFPELAVTGDRQEDIERADEKTLSAALETICPGQRSSMPWTAVVGGAVIAKRQAAELSVCYRTRRFDPDALRPDRGQPARPVRGRHEHQGHVVPSERACGRS